jgi:hypothetical protein
MSVLSGVVSARSRNVLPHEPEPAVERKSNAVAGWNVVPIVVVVLDDVDVLVVVWMMDVLVVVWMVDVLVVVWMVDVLVVVGIVDVLVVVGTVVAVGPVDDEVVVTWTIVDELVVGMVSVELVELVVATVEVLDVVAPTHVHSEEQVSPAWQLNAPVGELASQSSPASTTPLPQCVLVVVLELVLELVLVVEVASGDVELLDVVAGDDVLVVVELDVVVGGAVHCSSVSFTRSLLTSFAKNAPLSCAPCVSSSFEWGAQRIAVVWALREIRTLPPAKTCTSHAWPELSGPIVLPFSCRIEPMTLIVTAPRASRRAFRPSFRLQKV